MVMTRSQLGVVVAVLLLSGCSGTGSSGDSVWSTLAGEDAKASHAPAGNISTVAIAPAPAEANPQPTLAPTRTAANGNLTAPAAAPGASTGTYVGQKVQELRGDLQRLQDNISRHNAELQQVRQGMAQDASSYYSQVGAINSRLQVGTTPGNPQLIAQWNQAQTALDRMSDDIAKLNALSNQTASDSSLAAYILESAKAAYGLQGAVDEDHRQLGQLESDVNRATISIDRLLNSISEDISRQSTYVGNERNNLVALSLAIKNGELYGQSLANRSFAAPATPTAAPRTPVTRSALERKPLVIIRFDKPNVAYEQALYSAVSRALERRPSAAFDLVAVAPNSGSPAQVTLNSDASKRNAENVLRSLTNMGLPADRVSLSATTSASVQSNEVQIYVR